MDNDAYPTALARNDDSCQKLLKKLPLLANAIFFRTSLIFDPVSFQTCVLQSLDRLVTAVIALKCPGKY